MYCIVIDKAGHTSIYFHVSTSTRQMVYVFASSVKTLIFWHTYQHINTVNLSISEFFKAINCFSATSNIFSVFTNCTMSQNCDCKFAILLFICEMLPSLYKMYDMLNFKIPSLKPPG